MNHCFSPFFVVLPILAALAPHADAAAITFASGALQPRMLGPASFYQRNRSGVPGSVFRIPTAKAGSAVNDSLLSGGTLQVSGGVIKTGSGTLSLDNSGFINGGILVLGGGTLSLSTGSDGSAVIGAFPVRIGLGSLDSNGFAVRITDGTIFSKDADLVTNGMGMLSINDGTLSAHVMSGTLDFEAGQTLDVLTIDSSAVSQWSSHDPAAALAWASGIDRRDLALQNSSGSIQIGIRELAPNGGAASVAGAASAPVPEPASAVLLVIGALAVSQSRRGRES